MRPIAMTIVVALVLSSVSCSRSDDQLALQEAKNRELYAQLQRERELNAQRERELNAQRERGALAQKQRELDAQKERDVALQMQDHDRAGAPPKQQRPPAKPSPDAGKSIPKDSFTNVAIDDGFKQWSSAWMFDRYVPGSAHATDRGFKDDTYVIRGLFDFVRGGAKLTIPFAAAFTGVADKYRLSNLCYNDNTSGMTDCIDPSNAQQRAATQSRQFLGSIVLLGLVAAMSSPDDGEICEKRYSFFGEPYFYCY
jgi:hypothetical protein